MLEEIKNAEQLLYLLESGTCWRPEPGLYNGSIIEKREIVSPGLATIDVGQVTCTSSYTLCNDCHDKAETLNLPWPFARDRTPE